MATTPKLKTKLRPLLIQTLLENGVEAVEANEFIEDWLDRELELEH